MGRVRRSLETGWRQAQAHRAPPLTPEQGLIKKAATKITFAPIPSSFPTSSRADFGTRSPDVEKAPPSGHGAAHPALGLPKLRCCAPPATPSPPRVLARPPNLPNTYVFGAQQLLPLEFLHLPTRPLPRRGALPTPHPFPAPTPLPDPRRAGVVLPGGDCRSPSAIFLPPGAGPDACSPLSPFTPAAPPFPRLHQALGAF